MCGLFLPIFMRQCNDISGVDFRCHFYLNYSVINYFFYIFALTNHLFEERFFLEKSVKLVLCLFYSIG